MGVSCARTGHLDNDEGGSCCQDPRSEGSRLRDAQAELEEGPNSDDLVWDDDRPGFGIQNGNAGEGSSPHGENGHANGYIDDELLGDSTPDIKHARETTFAVLNAKDDTTSPRKLTEDSMAKPMGKSKEELLSEIETLVDVSYDILAAEVAFAELEKLLGSDSKEWAEVVQSHLFKSFMRKMNFFHQIGQEYSHESLDWFRVYEDSDSNANIRVHLDSKSRYVIHYRVEVLLPGNLANVLAVGNEIKLLPLWNPLACKDPCNIGRVTAHYVVVNYQMKALGGMYQVDILNELRRFSDVEGGIFVEYVQNCDKDHPCYKPPLKGFKRAETLIKNVWLACGTDRTQLTQMGTLTLPFPATKWLASSIGSVCGRYIIGGLVKNSAKTSEDGNPWLEPLAKDVTGLYNRLRQCAASKASQSRAGHKSGRIDLRSCFERNRIQRTT